MAIELHHLQPSPDAELSRLKARIASLEARNCMDAAVVGSEGVMMHMENINKFMGMVIDELQKEESKHPKFCDAVTPPGFDFDEEEKRWKKWNDESEQHYAADLFNEEFYESLNDYEHGDKEHALQELAQCGAVILRMMEAIENEV